MSVELIRSVHTRSRHRWWIVVTLLGAAGGFCSGAGADDAAARREYQFKAAYLINFLKFVEWPTSVPADVFTVCFVGGAGVYEVLASGASQRVGSRRLTLRQLHEPGTAAGCNALYLDATVASGSALASFESAAPVLTVSDAKGFTRNGGMIELFTENNRLRFNVNVDTAQKAGLRISSNLLQLAAAVEKRDGK